ncbi:MAG: hypothetical protein IPI05_05840 [Flavobacteriales bacterium]|nr:hypothetical protein [Flavobacteriales bacterium]
MAIGGLHLMGPFRDALGRVRDDYPSTDEAKAAIALLANLDKMVSTQAPDTTSKPEGPSYETDRGPLRGADGARQRRAHHQREEHHQ